ncbi:MAG: hypothetical protein WA265_13925 [Rhodomicrobium sp.]
MFARVGRSPETYPQIAVKLILTLLPSGFILLAAALPSSDGRGTGFDHGLPRRLCMLWKQLSDGQVPEQRVLSE